VAAAFEELVESGALDLPVPGSGRSLERFRALAEIAAVDLSLGRLAEGHADALAILSEASERALPGAYGVWVAGPPLSLSLGQPALLSGLREFCSGTGLVQHALVTARNAQDTWLLEIDTNDVGLAVIDGSWQAVGMADSASLTIDLAAVHPARGIGAANFYESRPGFWLGSLNVAACWYGGALGLARHAVNAIGGTPAGGKLVLAAELDIAIRTMEMVISAAAHELDAARAESAEDREARALRVRQVVYEGCQRVLSVAGELGGTHGATHDISQARRFADLPTYLRQHHPSGDRQRLGSLLFNAKGEAK